jgi:serine carboxypeptidase-like clade II
LTEYAWSHAVVSDEVYERIKKVCNFKVSNWTDDCDKAMSIVFGQYREIDIYNIYAPRCNLPQSATAPSVDEVLATNDQVRCT